jgi:hypothetical protein
LHLPDFPPISSETLEAIWEYRGVAPLPEDETAEARILWRHLQIALYLLGRPPKPGLSWAERPAAMMLEILRFFLGSPGRPWTDLYRARKR